MRARMYLGAVVFLCGVAAVAATSADGNVAVTVCPMTPGPPTCAGSGCVTTLVPADTCTLLPSIGQYVKARCTPKRYRTASVTEFAMTRTCDPSSRVNNMTTLCGYCWASGSHISSWMMHCSATTATAVNYTTKRTCSGPAA